MLTHSFAQAQRPARVVVLGAHGFVGGAIASRLTQRNIPVLALTRKDVDLLQPDAARALKDRLLPTDGLVAVSALAPVKSPAMLKDNITIATVIAEALKARPVAHILNIGSDAIYGDSPKPLSESSPEAPGSLHGVMHLARELILREASGNAPFATLRPTLIYGARDPHNGYGPNRFRRLAAAGEVITLFGEGEERRDHVLIDDVASLAVEILLHRSQGILNAATGTVISFRDCANLVTSHFSHKVEIKSTPRMGPMPHNGYRAFDPAQTLRAFPQFRYALPEEGFARVHAQMSEIE